MVVVSIIIGSILSGFLYHIGGCGKDGLTMYPKLPKWLFGRINSKIRDWGVSLVIVALICLKTQINPILEPIPYCLLFGLSWLSLSMYHKWLNTLLKQPKSTVFWFNWLAHGIGIGLALISAYWLGLNVWLILLRTVILGLGMMIFSDIIDDVKMEESWRGAMIILSFLIFGVR